MENRKPEKRKLDPYDDFEEQISAKVEMIMKWQPRSDVWPFTYGVGLLAGATMASSAYINIHYRRSMRLGSKGHLISLLPNVLLPALFATLTHVGSVSTDILLERIGCWTCLEVRAGAIQLLMAAGQATLMSSMLSYFMAGHHLTEVLPTLKQLPAHWWSITRPLIVRRMPAIVLGHLLLVSFVTNQEFQATVRMNERMGKPSTLADEELSDTADSIQTE